MLPKVVAALQPWAEISERLRRNCDQISTEALLPAPLTCKLQGRPIAKAMAYLVMLLSCLAVVISVIAVPVGVRVGVTVSVAIYRADTGGILVTVVVSHHSSI